MDIIELIAFIIVALLLIIGIFALQYIILKAFLNDLTEKELKGIEKSLYKGDCNDLM